MLCNEYQISSQKVQAPWKINERSLSERFLEKGSFFKSSLLRFSLPTFGNSTRYRHREVYCSLPSIYVHQAA